MLVCYNVLAKLEDQSHNTANIFLINGWINLPP
jgi:hypothetical protein